MLRKRLAFLWETHRILLLVFCVVIGLIGFFGVRTLTATIYWMDPAHQEQPLAEWMTPRYVARSYQIPPEMLQDVLFLNPQEPMPRASLGMIAAKNGLSMDDLQARVDAAAQAAATQREVAQ